MKRTVNNILNNGERGICPENDSVLSELAKEMEKCPMLEIYEYCHGCPIRNKCIGVWDRYIASFRNAVGKLTPDVALKYCNLVRRPMI
jgi:hypothetical protein